MHNQREWAMKRDELIRAMDRLGFPAELGEQVAKQLGSPKAMQRMLVYLYNVRPNSVELVVDEMLAICSDVEAWREKKLAEEANAKYNELLYYGIDEEK
ncbi:MAG: hypothetical protein K6G30_12240 [Acetatifactor sp.]|nr:hypothetical protein [Acetatifactor sp.]